MFPFPSPLLLGQSNGAAAFNPSTLSNLKFWWDPQSGLTLKNSNTSWQTWTDRVTGRVFDTFSINPALKSWNGITVPQVLAIDPKGAYYNGSNTSSAYTGSTLTIALVADIGNGGATFGRIASFADETGTNDWNRVNSLQLARVGTTTGYNVSRNSLSTSTVNPAVYNRPFIATVVCDGSTLQHWNNGSSVSSFSVSGNFQINRIGLRENASSATGDAGQGYHGDLLFIEGALSTTDRQNLETYLATKYGMRWTLPNTHPGYAAPTYSAEKATDPSFDNPTSWTTAGGWSISGGNAVGTSASNRLSQAGVFTVGKFYQIDFTYTYTGGSPTVAKLRIRTQADVDLYLSPALGTSGTISATVFADGTEFRLEADSAAFTGTIPSISIREIS